ncbi:MAG: hypothetical protein GXP38_03950 [Chloroflexi bacterium]|nr:hypothetical protein [Chloroflexota bacterium]
MLNSRKTTTILNLKTSHSKQLIIGLLLILTLLIPIGRVSADGGTSVDGNIPDCCCCGGGGSYIGDYVWFDADEDGIQDGNEIGVPGVTVKLFDSNDVEQAVTTTDNNGIYSFDVSSGDYYVKFILPPGYFFTAQGQGSDTALDSDADPTTGETALFTIGDSETISDIDAGLIRNPDVCFAVADSTTTKNDGSAEDTLAYLDRTTGATEAIGNNVGNTGTYNIEAIAFQPGGETLYAADAYRLGTLNLVTGQFTAKPNNFGSGVGYIGGSKTTASFSDVDSLSFDPTNGYLYGVTRRSGPDLLFRIDPNTGSYIPDAFPDPTNPSLTVDFVEVGIIVGLEDVDDIAIDPVTGIMYGSINDGSSSADKLVIIDKSTGAVTEIGTIRDSSGNQIQDMEGLSFFNDGMLYGTTGKSGPTTNGLYRIDKATAIATEIGNFTDPLRDFEGSDCLSGSAYIVIEKSTNGVDADEAPGPTIEAGQTVTWTYFVRNTGNIGLTNVEVTDDQLPAQNPICTISSLGPGESNVDVGVVCQATGTAILGQYENLATVTAETVSSGDVISDTDYSHYTGVDFHTAAIGNYVWHDLFHSQTHEVDGIQDTGEPGIEGVVVQLYDSGNNLVATDTTDASGYYYFDSLLPGTYTVKIADSNFSGGVLDGWYASPPNEGSDESRDSDGDRTNHEASVTLSLGEINNDVDFGFFRTSVDLQKTGPATVQEGGTITYHFRVENTGDVVLHGGVSVYDALIEPSGDHEIWNDVVWPGEVYEFDRTYTPSQGQCGELINTAEAVGHPLYPDNTYLPNVTDSDSWTVTINCDQPDLTVDKSFKVPDNRSILIVGEQVSFDVVTTNTGDTTISYLPLTDNFDTLCLTYTPKSSQPQESSYNNGSGTITWLDLTLSNGQDLLPTDAFTTTIHFEVTGVSVDGFNEAIVDGAQDTHGNTIPTRSDEVLFTCVDARISIDPDSAVNETGDSHTFTITVEKNEGTGWVPAAGVYPDVTITPTPDNVTDNCATSGTDANGQCTVVINSNSGGQFSAHAAADIDFGGGAVAHRETDGTGGNSDDATKTYVKARLTLTPEEAANQINDQHTFTAHLEFDYGDGNGFVNAPANEIIDFSIDSGPGTLGASSCTTDANGECTVTLDSSAVGVTEVSASWSGNISTTHGSATASASDTAIKHWADARLTLTPGEAANQINDQHTFTAHLEFNTGSGWADAGGETIDFSIDSGPGTLSASSCTTNANGECTVTLDSSAVGVTEVSASWSGNISTTHGSATASASDTAIKHWVDARLTLTPPTAVNEVDDQHTFTAHLEFNTGSGWADAAGETIDFSIDSGPGNLSAATCTTETDGECTVILESSTTGTTHVSASWSGNISTSHGSASASASDTAEKQWVDASISITPQQATNAVGDPHTFTITVMADDGSGPSPVAGVKPSVDISPTPDNKTDNCATIGTDSNGQCTVIINNTTAASFTANASVTVTVGGISVTRNTAGNSGIGGTGPASKYYVSTSVGDYVWNDLDGNGIQDAGEPPLEGVTVWLYDSSDVLKGTTATDVNGHYLFDNLAPGDYYVKVDLPTGREFSPKDQGVDDSIDSDVDTSTGKTDVFTLLANTPDMTWDAGQYCLNLIAGVVFFDANKDGEQGLGEDGIPDVVLDLYLDDGDDSFDANLDTFVISTTTQSDGSYSFPLQGPGTYFVVEEQPQGYDSTNSNMRTVALTGGCAGASSVDNNFGEIYGSIGDFIFRDSNGNGTQEPSETQGVAFVQVTVTNVSTSDVYTATSDVNGYYLVEGLPSGTYEVSVPATLPGLQRTTSSPMTVNLGLGEDYVDADFGYIAPTAVQFSNLTASRVGKGVLVSWQTAYEENEISFVVWRAQSENGRYKAVKTVPASNDPSGASYSWLDTTISPDTTYWYKIESVASGQFFGPVPSKQEPEPGGSIQLYIPFVIH